MAAIEAGTDPATAVAALGIDSRAVPPPTATSALCRLKHRQRAGKTKEDTGGV